MTRGGGAAHRLAQSRGGTPAVPPATDGAALDRIAGDNFTTEDLFSSLVTRSLEALGATAGGLMLTDDAGFLRVASASSGGARLLQLFQVEHQEGPCVDSLRSGQPVRSERLDTEMSRWPGFARMATEQGFEGVLALPMRVRGSVIGVLNLLTERGAKPLTPEQVPPAQAMADLATVAISRDRVARSRLLLAQQLQAALDSRVLIEQAKGALATRLDIDHSDAFDLIRAHARGTRRRLRIVAEDVINTHPSGDWERFRRQTRPS